MQIFVELLPRLGCANVAVMGSEDFNSLDIKCDKNKIRVGRQEFLLPGTEFADDSVSGLTVTNEGGSFRLKLKQNEKLPVLITPGTFSYGGRLKFPPPDIVSGQTYALSCHCGAGVGSITPSRVLPLPSGSWQADSLDWYCCVNKLKQAPVLTPRLSDLLYNSYCFVVDISNISKDAVDIIYADKELKNDCEDTTECVGDECVTVVTCKACDSEIGSLSRDSLHIWCSSVLLKYGTTCFSTNADVETIQDCFKVIINSFVIESISAMPRVMLRDRTGNSVILWVIDKNLTIMKSEEKGVVKESVIKILMKEGNDVPDKTVEVVELSCILFDTGLNILRKTTENLPMSFKVANEFMVAYLPKILNS